MYEEIYLVKEEASLQKKKKGDREVERFMIEFDQTVSDQDVDREAIADDEIIRYLGRSPLLGTYQCYHDYEKYEGDNDIYDDPSLFRLDIKPPEYHAVVVVGYKWTTIKCWEKQLALQVHTSNNDFGPKTLDLIFRHLFVAMESIDLVSPRVTTSEDL
jgi:hypothetical protein